MSKTFKEHCLRSGGLNDDESGVTMLGKYGEVLYSVDGKFTDAQVQEIIRAVKHN